MPQELPKLSDTRIQGAPLPAGSSSLSSLQHKKYSLSFPPSKYTLLEPENTEGQRKNLTAMGIKTPPCTPLSGTGSKLSQVARFPGRSCSHRVFCCLRHRLQLKMYSKAKDVSPLQKIKMLLKVIPMCLRQCKA